MTVGATVVNPGKSTYLNFPFSMHQGMGGPHRFQVIVESNDPAAPRQVIEIRGFAQEPR